MQFNSEFGFRFSSRLQGEISSSPGISSGCHLRSSLCVRRSNRPAGSKALLCLHSLVFIAQDTHNGGVQPGSSSRMRA